MRGERVVGIGDENGEETMPVQGNGEAFDGGGGARPALAARGGRLG